jgi:hypothetical protein
VPSGQGARGAPEQGGAHVPRPGSASGARAAKAGLVEAAHRRRRDEPADAAIGLSQCFGLAANPRGHARAAATVAPDRSAKTCAVLSSGASWLSVEIDARRPEPLAILGRRNDALGEVGARALAASRAAVDRRAALGHDERLLRKIEHLALLLADLRIRGKPRLAMRASLGRVLDNHVRLGDWAQRIAAAPLSRPPLRLPVRLRKPPDTRRFFFSPSLDGDFELLELSKSSRRRSSAFSASSASILRIREATTLRLRAEKPPTLGSEIDPLSRKIATPKTIKRQM